MPCVVSCFHLKETIAYTKMKTCIVGGSDKVTEIQFLIKIDIFSTRKEYTVLI